MDSLLLRLLVIATSLLLRRRCSAFPIGLLDQSCVSNTTLLAKAIANVDSSKHTTFVLCPNTVFPICDLLSYKANASWSELMLPLLVRTNTTIQCGHDGLPANDCVFMGGRNVSLVVNLPHVFSEINVQNATVRGVTFDGTFHRGVLLGKAGDITFSDCNFKVWEACGGVPLSAIC